jgi:hypothetical protein
VERGRERVLLVSNFQKQHNQMCREKGKQYSAGCPQIEISKWEQISLHLSDLPSILLWGQFFFEYVPS